MGDSVIQASVLQPDAPSHEPQLTAPGSVNLRSGPGSTYEIIGMLNANTPRPIVGRNADATWWQIDIAGGTTGWVANDVVRAEDTKSVPIVE